MPSSINKLQTLLNSNNIVIKNIYLFEKKCIYLEVLCLQNGNKIMVYIPSKYNININNSDIDSSINIYELEKFIINSKNNIEIYTGEVSDQDLTNNYKEILIESNDIENSVVDPENKLESKYQKHIVLNNLIKEDEKYILDIIRQIKRLKFCVEHLEYKIGFKYKHFLVCLTSNNELNYFCIKNYDGKEMISMIVIVNIKDLYNNINKLQSNINDVYSGVYNIISDTQFSHLNNFNKIINYKYNVTTIYKNIELKKQEYDRSILKLEHMLKDLSTANSKTLEEISKTENKYKEDGIKGLHMDIEKSHVLSVYNEELEKIQKLKTQIIQTLLDLNSKREHVYMTLDRLLFDNNVMILTIFKNVGSIESILHL